MTAHSPFPSNPASSEIAGQVDKLDAIIRTATAARNAASTGDLFASKQGRALVNAAFDLFECDQLYRLGEDIAHEIGMNRSEAA
jgi:hypothetical protein